MLDSPEALLRIIGLGENVQLELKEVVFAGERIKGPGREQLADELAAFANAQGGVLVLGVDDRTRDIVGIALGRLDAAERYVTGIVDDSIRPPLYPLIERLELPDSEGVPRPVLLIEVSPSLFVHQSPGGFLHRVGSAKRRMEPDFLVRLHQQRSQSRLIRFDEQPLHDASFADLDGALIDRFAVDGMRDDRETLACKLGMAARSGGRGPLLAAVFEAVVNAVAHRDYAMHGTRIRLHLYADRIELSSPGALPNRMTVDDLAYRQTSRNETLTGLLARCPIPTGIPGLETPRQTLMDRRGNGVGVILENSEKLSGKRPVYETFGDELRLTIYAAEPAAGASEAAT